MIERIEFSLTPPKVNPYGLTALQMLSQALAGFGLYL